MNIEIIWGILVLASVVSIVAALRYNKMGPWSRRKKPEVKVCMEEKIEPTVTFSSASGTVHYDFSDGASATNVCRCAGTTSNTEPIKFYQVEEKKMTISDFQSKITKSEGKKSSVKIGDVREILKLVNLEISRVSKEDLESIIKNAKGHNVKDLLYKIIKKI